MTLPYANSATKGHEPETIEAVDPWGQNHSMRVALMAAEATLAFLAGATKNDPYRDERRVETLRIVREALK